ncbi:MAG: O-antigen ligase family protein, partial [Thermodesulfobacteriota bacterium]
PWARFVLQIQALLLFLLWLLWSFKSEEKFNPSTKTYLLILFLLVCLIQILPIPQFVLGILSGKSLEIWDKNQTLLSSLGYDKGKGMFTISLYAQATWKETLLFLSYVAFGFVIARMLTSERRVKILLVPILAVSLFETTYGTYQYLLNIQNSAYPDVISATGTFVNRNHFAGFLEMSIPLALGYALSLSNWDDGKQNSLLKKLVSSDNLYKQILLIFLAGIMLLALILSKSRMGIFSSFLSLIFFYISYVSFRRNKTQKGWLLLFVIAIAILYGLWIGLYSVFERFLRIEAEAQGRLLVWKDMLTMIRDFPLFGTGFGTFSHVYPLYKQFMEKALVFSYAHNDYLQLLAETGVLGFLTLITALILFLLSSLKSLNRFSQEEDYFSFFLVLGGLTGIVSLLIHSLADFNLHIPSNALYFALLIGFVSAVSGGVQRATIKKRVRVKRRRRIKPQEDDLSYIDIEPK